MSSNSFEPGVGHEVVKVLLIEAKNTVHVVAKHVGIMSAASLLPFTHSTVLLHVTLILGVGKGSNHLTVSSAAAALIARIHGTVGATLSIPHVEI